MPKRKSVGGGLVATVELAISTCLSAVSLALLGAVPSKTSLVLLTRRP